MRHSRPQRARMLRQRLVGRRRLVDQQVLAGIVTICAVGARRSQDLRAQDRRVQRGALLPHRRIEERRDEVVERARDLGLHHRLGEAELALVPSQDLRRMRAAADHLDVVDRHHRDVAVLREQIAPALEVGDHHVGLELVGQLEVGAHVLGPALDRALQVREQRAKVRDLVVLVDDAVAPDLAHRQVLARALLQVIVGAARDHHLHVVRLRQVVEHDARSHRMPHSLADDTVEDPHLVCSP